MYMAKAKPSTSVPAGSDPCHVDAAEAGGHGHHHHHHLLHNRHQHHKAQAAPPVARVDRLEERSSDDINDSADAFIKRFRQQLELQRLQSIENYHQMLARGL